MDDFSGLPEDAVEGAQWQADDLAIDNAAGRTLEEVERRRTGLGAYYPFRIEGANLTYVPGVDRIYEFLLSISNSRSLTKGEYVKLPRTFERLSAELIGKFVGNECTVIHTGSPRDDAVGVSFSAAMQHVCDLTRESKWQPDFGLPEDKQSGDEGVDFIICRKLADNRPIGQFFIVGQCACGDNWVDKFSDINIRTFTKWFGPFSMAEPVRCFATPHSVVDGYLVEASQAAGLVFDRHRLVSIVQKYMTAQERKEINKTVKPLIELVFEN